MEAGIGANERRSEYIEDGITVSDRVGMSPELVSLASKGGRANMNSN
jgi:hypothetical protein